MELEQKERQLALGYYVIELLNATLAGRPPVQKPDDLTWSEIHQMAKKHSVEYMTYASAVKIAGQEEAELMQKWQSSSMKCAAQGKVQLAERARLSKAFAEAGIRIMPLKGWFLKEMYPKPEWRQMSDLDFLIDEENSAAAREVMLSLGYEVDSFNENDHDDEYTKKPWLHVEVHRCLLHKHFKNIRKYDDIWERSIRQEDDGSYHMSWEDYYLFFLEHLEKHYNASGSGIRSIMDIYVFLQEKGKELDWDYLKRKLEEHGLVEFRKKMESIATAWFENNSMGKVFPSAEEWLIISGIYGTREQGEQSRIDKILEKNDSIFRGKLAKFGGSVFAGYYWMSIKYPILKKIPILLPFAWIYRVIETIVKRPYRIREEIKVLTKKWEKTEK